MGAQTMIGITMYNANVVAVTLRLAIETQHYTWIHTVTYWGSIMLWFLFIFIECAVPTGILTTGQLYYDIYNIIGLQFFWLPGMMLPVWVSVLPVFAYYCYSWLYEPSPAEQVRQEHDIMKREHEAEKKEKHNKIYDLTPEERAARDTWYANGLVGTSSFKDEVDVTALRKGYIGRLSGKKKFTAAAKAVSVGMMKLRQSS